MSALADRKMGLGSMVLFGMNSIIGSGVFLLPGQAMGLAGAWSILAYVFVTLVVLAIAWCFAQCAVIFNRSGGAYIYAKEAFGDFIGFEIGVMRWIVGIIAWASLTVGFITVLSSIWPAVSQEPLRSLFILSLIGGLGCLNILGIKIIQLLSNVITIAKLVPLLLFVFIGIFFVQPSNLTLITLQHFEVKSFGAAALIIFYAYGGFETLAVASQEMKDPTKSVPVAIMFVVVACSTLYCLIQFIAIGILGPYLADNPTPIADVAEVLFGPSIKWFVTLAMLISIGGVNIIASFIAPRNGVILAEDEMIPSWIAQKGRFGTPSLAILMTMAFTSIVALSGNFTQLVAMSVVSRFVQYISTCLALYVFRRDLLFFSEFGKPSFKLLIPLFALSSVLWLLFQASPYQLYGGLGGLAIGVPLYFIRKKYTSIKQTLKA